MNPQVSRVVLSTLALACFTTQAQNIYPLPATFSGEPYNTQPIAPNFFAYVTNQNSNNVSGFQVNVMTGGLLAVPGSPFPTGTPPQTPIGIAVDPTGRCTVVTNNHTNTVQAFNVDPNSGTLTPYGAPVPAPGGVLGIAFEPGGRFVYATGGGQIFGYSLDSSDCGLQTLASSPYATPVGTITLAVHPAGTFLYGAINQTPGGVAGFAINPQTGALTPVPGSPFVAGNGTTFLGITPAGTFLYASNYNDGTISGYVINPATGALAQITGSPFSGVSSPEEIAIHQSGKWLYVGNYNGSAATTVSGFGVNPSTGALTVLPGSPYAAAAGAGAVGAGIEPGGIYLYTANTSSNDISAFTINQSNGVLTANTASGPGIAAGNQATIVFATAPTAYQNNLFYLELFGAP